MEVSDLVKKRLIENEKIFKAINEQTKNIETKYLKTSEEETKKIKFVCECSDETCFEKIYITFEDYKEIRAQTNKYVLIPHHEQQSVGIKLPSVANYTVVKKKEAELNKL